MAQDEQKTYESLQKWLKNDELAVIFCIDIIFIAHLWDDLVDKDKERTDFEISCAFIAALNNIPRNGFFQKYHNDLRPVMMSAILQWETANILETGDKKDRDKAYMLRASLYQIIHYCAYLIGGLQWANEVGPDIWRFYEEDIDTYLERKKKNA